MAWFVRETTSTVAHMSRAKIERRKRRNRQAAGRQRKLERGDEIDIRDSAEFDDAPKLSLVDRFNKLMSFGGKDDSPPSKRPARGQSLKRGAQQQDGRPERPPLPLTLGAMLSLGFWAQLVLLGFGMMKSNQLAGVAAMLGGVVLAVVSYMVYKRSYWAWIVTLVVLTFVLATFAVGAVSTGNPAVLLNAVFPAIPLALLLLPGTRKEITEHRADAKERRGANEPA